MSAHGGAPLGARAAGCGTSFAVGVGVCVGVCVGVGIGVGVELGGALVGADRIGAGGRFASGAGTLAACGGSIGALAGGSATIATAGGFATDGCGAPNSAHSSAAHAATPSAVIAGQTCRR